MRLLADREKELRARGIAWRITGFASRRIGWMANPEGFDPTTLTSEPLVLGRVRMFDPTVPPVRARTLDANLGNHTPDQTVNAAPSDARSWLRAAKADVLFEATSLNVENGEPAVDHLRAALEHGAHAITANKGPIVYAYKELQALADTKQRCFFFESTVMDGIPIFSLFRETLPTLRLSGFRGILNSTTNVILSGMEDGLSFDDSLRKAQELGVAETDATHDIDGWDAAVKVAALVTVLMQHPIRLEAIERQGIRHLSGDKVRAARAAGTPYKLVCEAKWSASGQQQAGQQQNMEHRAIEARVAPVRVPLSDAFAHVTGTSSIIEFHTDIFPRLVLTEENPGVYATAYGMLTDFIRAAARG